ncbi:protein kinase [Corallococcus exiguus]|uniref:serine/threonine-protein kinase n=1 Tax=Corallococcus exiguus TaxID=83462 RepID=UPI001A8D70BC|nr:serine/threonine-protein kinase [Corallococcus exiguus]MBN8469363.1 protein kinase [Corallococcus exiguus]
MAEVARNERTCSACGRGHGEGTSCDTLVREAGGGPGKAVEPPAAVAVADEVDPLVGTQMGSFRLVRRVGRGGMGSVYLAEHVSIGSRVAVKVLHEHLTRYPELVQRFHAEARAVNLIGHENIVSIFDLNASAPRPYLIMEFLEGAPLSAWVGTPLSAGAVVPMLMQVCDALHAAHARGIVHRDLKPDNIFLVKRGRGMPFVKVLDFGIAKLVDASMPETVAGIIVGTPEYMAPEQSLSRRLDGRADLYAVGVIAYQLLTGRLPFPDEGLTAQLVAHQTRTPPSPRSICPSVPPALEAVVLRALAKTPEERFPHALALRAALEQALATRPPSPRAAVGGPRPVQGGASPGTPVTGPRRTPPLAPPGASGGKTLPVPVQVVLQPGAQPRGFTGSDLSRGGVFLHATGELPPLFAQVQVVLPLSTGPLSVTCEVVRHVSPEQAQAWSMRPGFGVQFVAPSAALKARVEQHLAGATASPLPAPRELPDDAEAERVLAMWRGQLAGEGTHYTVLGLSPDVELESARERARELWTALSALRQRPLSRGQRSRLESMLIRVRDAGDTLGMPLRRARYDARLGNARGVARCLEAGLTAVQTDALRREYLAEQPRAVGTARVHFLTGNALERDGQLQRALESYERGLELDPLEWEYQQRRRVVDRALGTRLPGARNERARFPGEGTGP